MCGWSWLSSAAIVSTIVVAVVSAVVVAVIITIVVAAIVAVVATIVIAIIGAVIVARIVTRNGSAAAGIAWAAGIAKCFTKAAAGARRCGRREQIQREGE